MRIESNTPALSRTLLRVMMKAEEGSDRDLIARFVASRDEDAFAELVRRHGRMVLAVARRVTGHSQDAEDAFQATFLVLARRSAQVRQPEQLANWLYGVAYRTALEARAARRKVLEHSVSSIPESCAPLPPDDGAELRRVIDEELAALPEKYRAAVVLCELEGIPRKEAAMQLRIPEGTLSSRLAYARKLLASRLARRGFTATTSGVASLLGREATSGSLPRELIHRVSSVAVKLSGGTIPSDLVSPSVSHLTEGVLKVMFIDRLRASLLPIALACGFLSVGAYGLAQYVPAAVPQTNQQAAYPPIEQQRPGNQQDIASAGEKQKIPARGIEDEDVPYPSLPLQAVVRLEDGRVIVRQRQTYRRQPVENVVNNTQVTVYEVGSRITVYSLRESAEIAVFDVKGNRLAQKIWKEKLKNDVLALISFNGKLPNPRELTLFKDDVLVIVFPTDVPSLVPHLQPGTDQAFDDALPPGVAPTQIPAYPWNVPPTTAAQFHGPPDVAMPTPTQASPAGLKTPARPPFPPKTGELPFEPTPPPGTEPVPAPSIPSSETEPALGPPMRTPVPPPAPAPTQPRREQIPSRTTPSPTAPVSPRPQPVTAPPSASPVPPPQLTPPPSPGNPPDVPPPGTGESPTPNFDIGLDY